MSEADVLLPEQEGVSVRVVENALATKLIADGPHTFNGLHKVTGLTKAIQVEGELGKLQGLCSRDCKRRKVEIRPFWNCTARYTRVYLSKTMR